MKYRIGLIFSLIILAFGVWLSLAGSQDTGTFHQKGADDAQVTLIEFTDFACQECRQAQQLILSLFEKYQPRIKLVFRQFPVTSIHTNSLPAAIASEAAGAQGKFWEFSRVLFDQQEAWSAVNDPTELFVAYARQVDIPDISRFRLDIVDKTYKTEILSDMRLGNESGVNVPPTFFVNGEKVGLNGVQLAIEKVLSRSSAPGR